MRYFGIPYAAPPVDKLRFRPPEPPIPFEGIQNATKHGPGCMQKVYKWTSGPTASASEVQNLNGLHE